MSHSDTDVTPCSSPVTLTVERFRCQRHTSRRERLPRQPSCCQCHVDSSSSGSTASYRTRDTAPAHDCHHHQN